MHYVIEANTPEECKQEILDYLESCIIAERQKSNASAHDICLLDKTRLEINQAEIIARK
jgi:hypothetical protein